MKILKFFIWFLVYAIVLISVGELYLRFINYDPHSPFLVDSIYGWRLTKYQAKKSEENPNVTERTNSYGRRRSRVNENEKRKYNVAVLGDSYTYGSGVADENTFVWKLNERFPDISFVNYAVGGYGPYQNLLELRDILAKGKPDYVFYCVWHGSLQRNIYNMPGNSSIYSPCVDLHNGKLVYYKPATIPTYLRKFYILSFLYRVKFGLYSTYYTDSGIDEIQKRKTIFGLIFQQICQECKAHNTPLLLILLDSSYYDYFNADYTNETPVLDIAIREFDDHKNVTYRVMHKPSYHPNEEAHQIWANRIAEYIRSKHLLQQK